jgi:hypothetical protein
MTGLVRKAILLSVCGLMFAGVAMASVPNKANSTIPAVIKLVGHNNPADPAGTFTVTVRDLGGNTIQNSGVVVDLSGCVPDTRLGDAQDAPQTVDCPTKTVRTLTDASGVATFTIKAGSNNAGNSPGYNSQIVGCGVIFADGVNLGEVIVATFDQDGTAGLGANDLAAWFSDFFSTNYYGRSDYDGNFALGANDLAIWFNAFFGNGSINSASPYCP